MRKVSILSMLLIWAFALGLLLVPSVFADDPVLPTGEIQLVVYTDGSGPAVETEFEGPLGQLVEIDVESLEIEDKEFSFFIHNGQKITNPNTQFLVSKSTKVVVVFKGEDEIVAAFVDTNGQVLHMQYGVDEIELEYAEDSPYPSKPGFQFSHWSVNTNVTTDTIVKPVYIKSNSNEYVVIIQNESDVTGAGSYEYNEVATVEATMEDFRYWVQIGGYTDGEIVSYERTYKFTVLEDITLLAVTGEPVQAISVVYLNDVTGIRPDYESYLGQVNLVDGYTLIEAGLLLSDTVTVPTLDQVGVTKRASTSIHGLTNEFLISFQESSSYRYIRAYAIVFNGEEFETIYSTNGKHSTDTVFQLWVNTTWYPRPIVHIVGNFTDWQTNKVQMTQQSSPDNDYLATIRFEWFGNYDKFYIIEFKYRYNDSFDKPDGPNYISYINYAVTTQYLDFVGGH